MAASTPRSLNAVAVILIGGLAACGRSPQQIEQRQAPTVSKPVTTLTPPASYDLADADCQSSGARVPLTSTTIHSWSGGTTQTQTATFHNTGTDLSLTDQAIGGTSWDDEYQRTCDYRLGPGHYCDDGDGQEKYWVERGTGGGLRVCKDQFAYPRLSYEGVALTSLYFIQQAHDRYLQVTAADQATAPAPIRLSVLAQFITDFKNYPKTKGAHSADDTGNGSGNGSTNPTDPAATETVRTFITDNLAYFPDAQMITVFPVRKAEATTLPGFFWESSFVLGHEYGHHIDFTRHGRVLASVGLRWNSLTHGFDDEVALATAGTSISDRAQIAGAEAEAFADLLGFYMAGADGLAIENLPIIGGDRNVLSATFASGAQKVLTPQRAEMLFGRQLSVDRYPDFGDIHITGAVIAHMADAIFGTLTAAEPTLVARSQDETNRRYHLTLRFMDALVQATSSLNADDSGTQVMPPLTEALVAAVTEYLTMYPPASNDAVKAAVCKIVSKQMPALPSLPFSQDGHC